MTIDGVAIARRVLDRLEAEVAARNVAAWEAMCADDLVVFGTAAVSFGSEEVRRYLRLVVEAGTVRWMLDRWVVVHQDDTSLLVAASGEVESDGGAGPEREAFRLSLWLVRENADWKIGHFHGSVPGA